MRLLIGLLILAALSGGAILLFDSSPESDELPELTGDDLSISSSANLVESDKVAVERFCGDCHSPPDPSGIPKDGWESVVSLGFEMYDNSRRFDLDLPVKPHVLSYYRNRAPDSLPAPSLAPATPEGMLKFSKKHYSVFQDKLNAHLETPPAISNISYYPSSEDGSPVLMVCDMSVGAVYEMRLNGESASYGRLSYVNHPSKTTQTDLNQDGVPDYVVGDLGEFLPADHQQGRVLWLNPAADSSSGGFDVHEILTGVGRISDVQPGDYDKDGDLDLVVAEFGWRNSGHLFYFENIDDSGDVPKFKVTELDDRHGYIHTPTLDINGDGHLDFLAVISQEHECVELFLNRGDGSFRRQMVFAADNPIFGSTGIDLADLDNDGDLDILYTNGDMFDSFYLVPYHAVHWLENRGDGTWDQHELAKMPGIHRAVAGDMDNDGDMDIVCGCLISNALEDIDTDKLDSIIWLEQTAPGEFKSWSLETGNCNHATLDLADFDRDGDIDIAVGQFQTSANPVRTDVTIWWNNTTSSKANGPGIGE
ncbi:MAG TPA: hypothetical protein DCP67_03230 [Planctomycetaceae bacterium]|nr:hypothetical protein [Planctomycetaceae bacterium]